MAAVLLILFACFSGNAYARDPVTQETLCGAKSLMALGIDIAGSRLESQGHSDFAPIRPFLKGNAKEWYSISVPLDPTKIDPVFVEVAKLTGGTAFFGGGSDLIELALLNGPKLASPGEVNVIRPHGMYDARADVSAQWTHHEVDIPPWKERKGRLQSLGVNGESGLDLIVLVENANRGRFLITGNEFINVPFKHGHLATVTAAGEGRLYFRTPLDFENWRNKILTLPDEDHCPANFFETVAAKRTSQALLARRSVVYSLIVYMRAKPQGWKFSPKSAAILKSWIAEYQGEMGRQLKTDIAEIAGPQGVSASTVREVFEEFGVR